MIPRNCLSAVLVRLVSTILPAASAGTVADKPAPCRWCGTNVGVEHITEQPSAPPRARFAGLEWVMSPTTPAARRYAQVVCRMCHTTGPRVLFEPGEEWPHIAAEQSAVAKWDAMMRRRAWA